METLYDVLRTLVSAARKGGHISEADHADAHAIINDEDPAEQETRRKAETELSDTERAELERLQAKQQSAEQASREPAPDPGQPAFTRAAQPADVAAPGAGFHQEHPYA